MNKTCLIASAVILLGATCTSAGVSVAGDTFNKKNVFQGQLMGVEWSYKEGGGTFSGRNAEITFYHRKSNGWVAVNSFALDVDDRLKPTQAMVESYLWVNREKEVSRKTIQVDGKEAVWIEAEDERGYYKAINVYIRLSSGHACWITYGNTSSFFTDQIPAFEEFLGTFKVLVK